MLLDIFKLNQFYSRTDAVDMLDDSGDEVLLSEVYANVIDTYQKKSGIARVKAQGLPSAGGSIVFHRLQNASVGTYGAARTATKGSAVLDDQVTCNLSVHKEIVEELEKFDIDNVGVGNLIQRRSMNHALRMTAQLDRAALTALKAAAATASQNTNVTYPNATTPDYYDLTEQVVLKVETVTNDYVDGVDRDMIVLFLKPSIYSKLQQKLESVYAYNGTTGLIEVPGLHGVQVVSSHYIPSGTDFIVTTVGNIAQPVQSDGYTEGGRIPLSKSFEVSLFYDYGVEVLANDLVFEGEFSEAEA